jgi:hypothetical protein
MTEEKAVLKTHPAGDLENAGLDELGAGLSLDTLKDQDYDLNNVAFLSEDETAFGGRNDETEKARDKETCSEAVRLYYPRDTLCGSARRRHLG